MLMHHAIKEGFSTVLSHSALKRMFKLPHAWFSLKQLNLSSLLDVRPFFKISLNILRTSIQAET